MEVQDPADLESDLLFDRARNTSRARARAAVSLLLLGAAIVVVSVVWRSQGPNRAHEVVTRGLSTDRLASSDCDELLGFEFLHHVRAHNHSLCQKGGGEGAAGKSSVLLYSVPTDPGECGSDSQVAVMENASLVFDVESVPAGAVQLEVACEEEGLSPLSEALRGGITLRGDAERHLGCSQWVEEDTIVVANPRDEYLGNYYHTMEEVFSMFETATLLGRDVPDFRYLILWERDDMPEFLQLPGQLEASAVLSQDAVPDGAIRQIVELWSVLTRRRPGHKFSPLNLSKAGPPSKLCFRKVVFPMRACLGSILPRTWSPDNPCRDGNPIAMKVADMFRRGFSIHSSTRLGPEAPMNVALVVRKAGATEGRGLANTDDIVHRLQQLPGEPTVKTVDFAEMSIEEQVELVQTLRVVIGVHGAGLTHLVELPPGSGVVELTPWDGPSQERQCKNIFRHFSEWTGHPYRSVPGNLIDSDLNVDIDELVDTVATLL